MRYIRWLLLAATVPLSAKNLLREDVYVRRGFASAFLQEWPERSKALDAWKFIPSTTGDNRTLRIADLGAPFPKPGIYFWPVRKIHDYTALTRFFLLPQEKNAPKAWGLRVGSIGDNWQIYLNGQLIASQWYADAKNEHIYRRRAIRDFVVEFPAAALATGENLLTFRFAGDDSSSEIGFFLGQPYEVAPLTELLHARQETIILILICIYLAIGFYHLLLYVRRRKETYNLYFGLFCVGLFVYLMTRTSIIFELFVDSSRIQKVEFVVLFNMLTFFVFFVDTLFENRISLFGKSYAAVAAILSVAAIPTTPVFAIHVLRVWQVIALFGIVYFLIFRLFRAVKQEIKARMRGIAPGKLNAETKQLGFLSALKQTFIYSPPGNLVLGMLTILATSVFDILDSIFFATGIAFSKYGFAMFVIGIAVMLANRFLNVHAEVEELNANLEKKVEERTHELQESLLRVSALKNQQDADYFLTSLLLKPLAANSSTSKNLQIEYLIKQKKTFEFRRWKSEIGGDINMAASITLKDKPYVVFVNADAMGKSMQGAGGALVLGAVFQSTIERMRWTKELSDVFPEIWLHTTFLELHRIFESFEGSMLISLVMGVVDEASGLLYFINAEHPSIALLRGENAEFLGADVLRKLGTPGVKGRLQIQSFQLEPHDVLVMGSDGRDDVILGKNPDGTNIINENENLFLDHVRESGGDLEKIFARVEATGEIMDDLSLLKIAYEPQVDRQPPSPAELAELGAKAAAFVASGDGTAAFELYVRLHEAQPLDLEICFILAQVLRREKKIKQALQWAERCVLRDAENVKYLLQAAELNIMMKRFHKARGYIQRVQELEPQHARAAKLDAIAVGS